MRKAIFLLFLSCLYGAVKSQTRVVERIWLVGDAGKLKNGENPQLNLIRQSNLLDEHTTVLFLGDNIYPTGLPDSLSHSYADKKNILDQQINLVKGTAARGLLIPGNHDWLEGRSKGWDQIKHQAGYVQSLALPNVQFLPEGGCPGPVEIKLADNVLLVVMDSQWWLQQNERPGESSDCECKTEDEVLTRLNDIVFRNRDKILVFAAHHPFKSNGPHGGYFTFKQHLFPLTDFNEKLYIPFPLVGSLYPLLRASFGHIQDLRHPEYKDMRMKIDEVLSRHPYCIRVAGHEHTLQYIQSNGHDYIVSGAASKTSQVKYGKETRYAEEGPGVAVLEIREDQSIALRFFTSEKGLQPTYDTVLKKFVPVDLALEKATIPVLPDSASATAAPGFKAGSFKKMIWGSNYRNEWTTEVKVPVFDIGKVKGGLKAVSRGGRLQSMSLRLEDSSGHQYVLRSVEKYPERVLPEEFRETFIKDALVDAISSSYPYAALSVPIMATAAGIPHANPKLYYVTDDPRFGVYKSDFSNGLYIFEEREPGGIKKTYSTPKVLEELQEDNDNRIDDREVLQARLLDMFMMDFDRHEDQWRWGRTDNGKGITYYAIPRDRDQPFFINRGFLPKIISRNWLQPRFQGFSVQARDIRTFNFNGRYFDRLFLNRLSKEEWEKATDSFIPLMTDSVIDAALRQQPVELQQYSFDFITRTLKERRNFLKKDIMEYYKFLAREVDIYGSDKKEWFEIDRNRDGSVKVSMFKMDKEGKKGNPLYERVFSKKETHEILIWAMGGDDHFEFRGNTHHTILVRVIGGPGKDEARIESKAPALKTRIYDLASEQNQIEGAGRWTDRASQNPSVHNVDRHVYKYNIWMPLFSVAYNPDDGIFAGAGVKYTGHGFRKEPYKVTHQLKAAYAFATGAYNFKYDMHAVDAVGQLDLVAHANIRAPNNTINFFGLGNETIFDKSNGKKIKYYRSRYNLIEGGLLLKYDPMSKLSISFGPVYQHYHIDSAENVGRILSQGNLAGIDPATLYRNKSYLGGRLQVDLDTRDNKVITHRGIFWRTHFQSAGGLNHISNSITQLGTDMSVFMSFSKAAKFVIGARAGAGINFGNYEFFQAQYLGGTENLRGFRKYRFGGDKMAFGNLDLRLHLFDFRGYLLPGSVGILGFTDVGRVWYDKESSSAWHSGYGGGIWLAPAKRYVITFCYAHSSDGGLPFISLGFEF